MEETQFEWIVQLNPHCTCVPLVPNFSCVVSEESAHSPELPGLSVEK